MALAVTVDFITKSGLKVLGTAEVTSSTNQSGALQVNGGAAISKNLIVGTTATIYGPLDAKNTFNSLGAATLGSTLNVTGIATFNSAVTATSTLVVGGAATLNSLGVTNAATVGSSLTVTGVSNLNAGINVTGVSTLTGALIVSGQSTFNNTSTFNAPIVVSGSNTLTVGSGATSLGGTLGVSGVVSLTNATTAAAGTGALVVTGGTYIGDNLYINSTAANTVTNTSNALYLKGGAYIDKSLVVEGAVLFKNGVTFSGTATYVYSTNTYYTDNFIDLHIPPTGPGGTWTVDDGKDIGLIFNYFKGTDKNGFLGIANDTGYLEWYSDGTEVGNIFTTSTYGTFKLGSLKSIDTTNATSTITGAVTVVGGVGVGGNIFAGGDVRGGTLTGGNLTAYRLPIVGPGGTLYDNTNLSYNTTTNVIVGTITTANTSTNLAGGNAGSIPIQSASGVTGYIPIGSSGYVLTAGTNTATWTALSGVTAGNATTATNIAGGAAGYIPFQTATGLTGFSSTLTFTAANSTLKVDTGNTTSGNIYASGAIQAGGGVTVGGALTSTGILRVLDTTNSTNTATGALQVAGGATVFKDLRVGGDVYVGGNIYLDGVGLDTVYGTTATFTTAFITGTNVALNVTNGATFGAISVTGQSTLTNLTVNGVVTLSTLTVNNNSSFAGIVSITNTTQSTDASTGALVVSGGVGIAKDVNINGGLTVGVVSTTTAVSALTSNAFNISSFIKTNIAGTGAVNLDTFASATYRSARYLIQATDGANIHLTEVRIFHNGTDVYLTEYGVMTNNGELGTFDSQLSAGVVTMRFTPVNATNMTIKLQRTAITV